MNLLMISNDRTVVAGRHGAFWNTLRGLHEHWSRIDLVCPHIGDSAQLHPFENVHFHPLPKSRLSLPWHPLQILKTGLRVCKEQRSDLIVAHSYGFQRVALGGLLLAGRTGLPLAVEVHHVDGFPRASGTLDRLRKRACLLFLRMASRRATAFRVVNRAELVPLLRSLGIPAERILCLYAVYLDLSVFHPDPSVEKRYDMIFVGRLVENKGIPLLLDAFERVKRQRADARLLIVGRGSLEGWLRQTLARRGLDGVEHVRWVDEPTDVARLYQQSRIVVCASNAEGGPRFMVEGMACGLPAVSTPVGLMKEIIEDGANGRIVSSWSAEELAGEITRLLDDEELYRRCAEHASRTATRFEYSKSIGEYALGYRKLIEVAA